MNRSRQQRPSGTPQGQPAASAEAGVGTVTWFMVLAGTAMASLFALVLGFIPPLAAAVNFLVVLSLWMWAKHHGLRPPTFASAARKVGGKLGAAAEQIPGSDFIYIALGGITPLIYLAALWWNNRSQRDRLKSNAA
ncbi:MAG: hypothetical protein HY474_00825 [Candidatus Sungbacteria bacterium]|uniref:Uncharacterized protein n=1 Tax=Candidatus Sungiibacteriota bacterium TaxID=2750080 RepID=A0A932YVF2_9BACT|nr:hypothetical protein [Candidatus Sungbacteria bacterium]